VKMWFGIPFQASMDFTHVVFFWMQR